MRPIIVAGVLAIASAALAQSTRVVWQPPKLDVPKSLPNTHIPKAIIGNFRIGTIPITLEETLLKDVERNLGGTIGSSGDASEAIEWLCFHGADAHGRWALWLENSEMSGGGKVDGFIWQRIPTEAAIDRRCRKQEVQIDMPIPLVLGLTESEVRGILGEPTTKYRNTLIFDHLYKQTIHNESFMVSNPVFLELRDGVLWAVQVWKIGN